jgi:SAM-dependent methyltransferase
MSAVRLVTYTTRYRGGGPLQPRAAATVAEGLSGNVRLVRTETKRAFVQALQSVPAGGRSELHFVGHSGMYGPMFHTSARPEQLSPHEWRSLTLPFADDGRALFHACRTARWFAPFFADRFGVPTAGHHLYTTYSRRPDRYLPPRSTGPVHVIAQPGLTSHGLRGAIGKRTGWLRPEPLRWFQPRGSDPIAERHAAYDDVAEAYDEAFRDIRVRGPEWDFLSARIPAGAVVLDVGCGTGALLRALQPRLAEGIGVDVSRGMLARARAHGGHRLRYAAIDGPRWPVADHSVDVVVSLLSWRYLDFDPALAEVLRVLKPGGRLLVVDMVTRATRPAELPALLVDRLNGWRHLRRFPRFGAARDALVAHPAWSSMLQRHPIRAEHELAWFFGSRFPGRSVHTLDRGRTTRMLAFDSGPVHAVELPPLRYP